VVWCETGREGYREDGLSEPKRQTIGKRSTTLTVGFMGLPKPELKGNSGHERRISTVPKRGCQAPKELEEGG
jgi:hypothetical protein